MTLLKQDIDVYHAHLIQDLATAKLDSKLDSTVSIWSGDQHITMQAVLLRNVSNLLKETILSPCSCTDTCIILPHTQYPSLDIFVSLLHGKVIPRVSKDIMDAVNSIAASLGVRNITNTENDVFEDTDGADSDDKTDKNCSFNSTIKVNTIIAFSDQLVQLQFPKSRLERKGKPNPSKYFQANTFKGRVQKEYNVHPIGQYMGPYDQNKEIALSAQLPHSDLDFQNYTEFSHSGNQCFKYEIKNYEGCEDLNKISSYTISSVIKCDDEKEEDDDIDIFYTCHHNRCRIPCPCFQCCSDIIQCNEHKLCHPDLFNEKMHAISIRSSKPFCEDDNFFENSYIIKYPGIPLKCKKCCRDLVNHHGYHFEYHANCRFCSPTFFKAKADSIKELEFLIKDEAEYYKTVCPYCNKRFCQAYFAKKHIQTEHGDKPFKCGTCDKDFQSFEAKTHHEKTVHTSSVKHVDCNICDKKFKSEVHLNQHMKYVHSETRKWSCDECGIKFKQKRDLRVHMLHIHNINYSKEDYDEEKYKSSEEFKCKLCKLTFKYKKNLGAHVKSQHTASGTFQCDECEASFRSKRNLVAHKKYKHEPVTRDFSCPFCGKSFSKRWILERHKKLHDAEDATDD